MSQRQLLLFATLLVALLPATASAEPLSAGIAVVDVTPPVPYRMSGYFRERLSTGILDPLYAKAIVFQQGDTAAALVFVDMVGISHDVSSRARERAAQQTGIPVAHIAIAATHSHTGPLYFGALRAHFHKKTVEEQGRDIYETVDYPTQLVEKLVAAIKQAQAALQPVDLAAGYAQEKRISFNRRFHMKNGPVRFNPGYKNPNIIRAAGPIDPEVGLISLAKPGDKKPFAAVVSFALHLDTIGGTKYSGDYPKHLQDKLQAEYGEDFLSLFGAGTCGDINHVDVTAPKRRKAPEIGGLLAESVSQGLKSLTPIKAPELAVRQTVYHAPLQKYTAEQTQASAQAMDGVADRKVPFLKRVETYKIAALALRGGDTIPLEIQVFRLSKDVAIVTLPGEVFVEFGMAIKHASPFKTTLVIELTNDAPGYIPTQKAFAEGSYETVNSRVQTGSGEKMVDAAIGLLRDLGKNP
ncbi:neutral/alkaline non-lysosomal ceramidase N-terminal domain-containing protein [Symmachiella dynata]|uniref:neutral/alkaline non-lysosomal ceramidase N-terminal domain-containing protein n=1 Tax=Symmachiella dynata TaxID=2527995 RepID=UPI0030ED849E